MVSLVIVIHLTDALQTGRRSHELEDIIHGKSAAHLGLAGRCLEAWPHLEANVRNISDILHVEEARWSSKLLQIGLSEGLLEDDVDEVLANVVVLVLKVVGQMDIAASLNIDLDRGWSTTIGCLENESFLELRQRVDHLSTYAEDTDSLLEGCLLGSDDLMDLVGLPEFVRLDLESILVHASILSKGQPVLVWQQTDLLKFAWCSTTSDHGLRIARGSSAPLGCGASLWSTTTTTTSVVVSRRLAGLRLLAEAGCRHASKRIVALSGTAGLLLLLLPLMILVHPWCLALRLGFRGCTLFLRLIFGAILLRLLGRCLTLVRLILRLAASLVGPWCSASKLLLGFATSITNIGRLMRHLRVVATVASVVVSIAPMPIVLLIIFVATSLIVIIVSWLLVVRSPLRTRTFTICVVLASLLRLTSIPSSILLLPTFVVSLGSPIVVTAKVFTLSLLHWISC